MRKSLKLYNALPKHKAELVNGKMIIGGSLEKSAMTLVVSQGNSDKLILSFPKE